MENPKNDHPKQGKHLLREQLCAKIRGIMNDFVTLFKKFS